MERGSLGASEVEADATWIELARARPETGREALSAGDCGRALGARKAGLALAALGPKNGRRKRAPGRAGVGGGVSGFALGLDALGVPKLVMDVTGSNFSFQPARFWLLFAGAGGKAFARQGSQPGERLSRDGEGVASRREAGRAEMDTTH